MTWENWLVAISIISAILSVATGVACWYSVRRLGFPRTDISDDGFTVDVIIPARNEKHDLEKAVRSILAQKSIKLRVIVINDHSTDGTREIADALAESDDRVLVIHNPPLVDGWLGKTNAMQHGLRSSRSDYILFTDADIIYDPECLQMALSAFNEQKIDFLSLCPSFEFESFWENVLLPHTFVAGTTVFAFQDVNSAESENAAAAGAFMLTRRDVVDRIGGLERVKSEMIDDIELAKAVKREGFETRLWLSPDLIRVRMFKSNHDAFWGFTKNILGVFKRVWMAVPFMFLPVLVYWVPIVTCVLGFAYEKPMMIASGLLAYMIQLALIALAAPICRIRFVKALFFPLAAIPVACCIAKALYFRCVSNAVVWRGRAISVGKSS